ncbi:uncharacterized protein LY89DRAFT_780023 [Mollisia scopiformis]|uniref:Uncharacterized protein n=1 Tax=Mollisia scopiformis TaxID=149040 RepID=A0A194XJ49_MOLSC|nr:uncharacterized protein LY89DRAFT_780023 [Mollisia scopiformis]KUJ20188.1 hypothetical protein LY89DRAFT_780023 [Mollisia scopiformis]
MADFASGVISNIRFLVPALLLILLCTLTVNFISLTSQHENVPNSSGNEFTTHAPALNSSSTQPQPLSAANQLHHPPDLLSSQRPLDEIDPPRPLTHQQLVNLATGGPRRKEIEPAKAKIPLITYVYTESPSSYANLKFFLQHGLYIDAHFIFVLNGKLDKKDDQNAGGKYDYETIWPKDIGNVRVLEREKGTCFELGTHAEILNMEGGSEQRGRTSLESGKLRKLESRDEAKKSKLMERYERFILLSSKAKGPFVPKWSKDCWSDVYLGKVNHKVKLVAATSTCASTNKPHIESLIWATDSDGLAALLDPEAMGECFKSEKDQEAAEIRTTVFLLEDMKYEVDVMSGDTKCGGKRREEGKQPYGNGTAMEKGSVHPFETMFVRSTGGSKEEDKLVESLSEAQGERKYSSFDVCAKKAELDIHSEPTRHQQEEE